MKNSRGNRAYSESGTVKNWVQDIWQYLLLIATAILLLGVNEVEAARDLTVTIQQLNPNPVLTNTCCINYKVTVKNLGTDSASNVLTVVTFPGTFKSGPTASGTDFTCTTASTLATKTVSCTTSQVGGGAEKIFNVQESAPTAIVGNHQFFSVTAVVDPFDSVGEVSNGNNTGTVTTSVETRADLIMSVSGSATSATAGEKITYVMTMKNIGDQSTTGQAVATLPQQVNFDHFEIGTFGNCLRNGQQIFCAIGSLAPGAQASANIIVKVPNLLPNGTLLLYGVTADAPLNAIVERSETNNVASVVTTIRSPADLELTGTVTKKDFGLTVNISGYAQGPLDGFTLVTLRLRVHNRGPGPSPATTVRVNWPTPLQNIDINCPAGTHVNVAQNACRTGTVSRCFDLCSVPNLIPDSTVEIDASAIFKNDLFSHVVEFGSATVDPNRAVLDPNTQNNVISIPNP